MKIKTMAALAALSLGILGGCTEQSKSDYDKAGEELGKAANNVGDALKKDTAVAGEKVKEGAATAGDAMKNAAVTGKVKSALVAEKGIDAEHINVDTEGNKVILKGHVDTEEQKQKAEQVAQANAGSEYTIENQLAVGSATPADNPTKNQ